MVELREIVEKLKSLQEEPQSQKQFKAYKNRALRELKEKGYYTIAPLGNEDLSGPIELSMHPAESKMGIQYFHNHDYFEMVYLYRGSCINRFPQYTITLSQGDVMLLNPMTLHGLYTDSSDTIIFNFLIPKKRFHSIFTSLMSDNCVSNFIVNLMYQIDTVSDYLIINHQPESHLNILLDQMIWEFFNKNQDFYFIMQKMLELCFAYMSRDYWKQEGFTDMLPNTMQLSSIITYIYKHYNKVTLKEISYLFGYNEKYLSRLIRQKFGISYQTMIKKIRMKQAESLLTKTNMSVDEIAAAVGYTNITSFYKFFQEEFNKTPSEYRKHMIHCNINQ